MPIILSNLAMRFYIRDGWTKELLDSCCIDDGSVHCFHPKDMEPYYVLDHRKYSAFDATKLVKHVSEIRPPGFWSESEWDEFRNRSWEQTIERYNW